MKIDLTRYIDIPIPPGKKISNILTYASLILPNEVQDDFCQINQFGCVTSDSKDTLLIVQTHDNHFSLLPGPEFSPRLYRGQTAFYDHCVPLLFRQPLTQIKYLTDLLKKYEFYKLMFSHPVVNYLYNWHIGDMYFEVDMEGLSAHYEFGTQFLDVSRSKDVAMFFALCEMKDNKFTPIMDENRVVVLYTIDLKKFIEKTISDFHVVGFQALPRPDVQNAYSVIVGYNENFNDYKSVSYEKFRINRKKSIKYFELFEGGELLFPNDPIDDWQKAIKQSTEIDKEVLSTCFEKKLIPNVWSTLTELTKFLKGFGYNTREKKLQFTDLEKTKIIQKWNENPPLSLERVKCRFSADAMHT